MRNATQPYPQTQQHLQQQQLNDSIQQVSNMMNQLKNVPNREAALAQMLQSNPNTAAIASMLQSNGNLQSLAQQIADANGYNLNEIISKLPH